MATRTNPLVSAAVLASTAAIAVATPAIMPSVQIPSPHALQAAKVQLATFADLLSITPVDWNNALFVGYGEAISPNQDPSFDWAAALVSPFSACDFNCTVNGISGVAYLALDALLNGNGTGYAPVLKDPTKPYNAETNPYVAGYPTWSISSVNYFFEGGPGPGTAYLVTQPFGDPNSPLYNPEIANVISQAFQGSANVTIFYVTALDTIAKLALSVPTIGPYVYGAIQSYLGPNTSDSVWQDYGYFAGLSGLLKYAIDVVLSGGNPFPPYGPPTSAASTATLAAAAALPAAAASVVEAPKVEAPAPVAAKEAVAEVEVSAPADSKSESAPAVSEPKVSAPAVSEPKVSVPEVSVPEASAPAPEVEPVVEAPSVPDVKAPVVDSTPVKDLGEEIAKAEAPAAGTVSEPKADVSDSKAGGSDAKGSTPAATSDASEAASAASDTKAGASDAGGSDAGSAKDSGDSAE